MQQKQSAARRSATNKPSNGNGNGNGQSRGKAAARAQGPREAEVLTGQPPIVSLIAGARARGAIGDVKTDGKLDKAMLLAALIAFKKGDFSVRMPLDLTGIDGKIADAFNDVIELNQRMSMELDRLSRVVGKE